MRPYRGIHVSLIAAIAIAVVAASPVPPARAQQQAAAPGASGAVQEAIAFRRLQSEFMVAALSCNDYRHHAEYNTFVTLFRAALGENARVLRGHFRRLHGGAATKRLDDFMTMLANEASLASMADRNFCANALFRFAAVNNGGRGKAVRTIIEEAELAVSR